MFSINFKEDGSIEILGRVVARNGSGEFTGKRGEGRFILQEDVDTITCTHYDLTLDPDKEDPTDIPVDAANVILDAPDDTGESWDKDNIGFNFAHHLTPGHFPEGGHTYRLEYEFQLIGGYVFHEAFEGPATEIYSS